MLTLQLFLSIEDKCRGIRKNEYRSSGKKWTPEEEEFLIALVDYHFGRTLITNIGDGGIWTNLHSLFNAEYKGRTHDAIVTKYRTIQRNVTAAANSVSFLQPEDESNIPQEFRISVLIENRPKNTSYLITSQTCPGVHFTIVSPMNLDRFTQSLYD